MNPKKLPLIFLINLKQFLNSFDLYNFLVVIDNESTFGLVDAVFDLK